MVYHKAQYFVFVYLFFILTDVDVAGYADDNIPYVVVDNINGVIKSIEKSFNALFEWFKTNLYIHKCHLLVSSNENASIGVDQYELRKSECEKLLNVSNLILS